MVYTELGRFPLSCIRKIRIIKYWLKISASQNCILKSCYEYLVTECENHNKKNWVFDIKKLLMENGMFDLWETRDTLNTNYIFNVAKQRILDNSKQTLLSEINSSSKCIVYKNIVDQVTLQSYLSKPIPVQYKKMICKLRLSSHCLSVETGRYKNIPLHLQLCPLCKTDIEDEFHFLLKCPFYASFREKHIKKYYYERPSVFKLIQLLSTENVKELCNLGKFINNALKLRISL